jgi:microcompartment protein CcmL/EutN
MIDFALGLIETKGLVGAIEAADAMVKTANVKLIGRERTDPGMITVKIIGDTAAVRSAVESGAAAAQRVSQLISKHIIPRPADDMDALIFAKSFLPEEEIAALLGNIVKTPPQPDAVIAPEPEVLTDVNTAPEKHDDRQSYITQLESMTVPALRNLARGTQGISIFGRQISVANKNELIAELLKVKFGN